MGLFHSKNKKKSFQEREIERRREIIKNDRERIQHNIKNPEFFIKKKEGIHF